MSPVVKTRALAVMLIDDDPDWHLLIRSMFREMSSPVTLTAVGTYAEGAAAIEAHSHDLYLIDQQLGGDEGLDLIRRGTRIGLPSPMILLTGSTDDVLVEQALQAGAADYLPKAVVDTTRLGTALRHAIGRQGMIDRLREAESRLRAQFDAVPNPTYVWKAGADDDFTLVDVNEAAIAFTRKGILKHLGDRASAFFADSPAVMTALRASYRGKKVVKMEGPFVLRTTGEERYLVTTYAFVPPDCVSGHTEDITERRKAEEALRTREREFRSLFDAAADSILVMDDAGRYVDGNPASLRLLNLTRDRLLSLTVCDHQILANSTEEWHEFLGKGRHDGRRSLTMPDGRTRTVEFSATAQFAPGRHLAVLRDVTERVDLERDLQHVQRLDSVGRLAGGIAHDFNNLMTAIVGFSDLLINTFPPGDPRVADVSEIQHAAQSAVNLTKQLLAFSRKQVMQPVIVDVNEHIRATGGLLKRMLGQSVTVATDFRASHLRVLADPTQLEQIVLNLGINARDAMNGRGTLTIVTDRTMVGPGEFIGLAEMVPGVYARVSVTDTGEGMTPEVQERLFEPFFTTKPKGRGTGLGLSTVYGIVKQSEGYIRVESTPGVGTTFNLYFPCATSGEQRSEQLLTTTQSDTVLVVDDDRAVRVLAARSLRNAGFSVVEACSAEEALVRVKEYQVKVLLTDVVLEGLSGLELARELRSIKPSIPVLLMSGYVSDSVDGHGDWTHEYEFIAKPFTPELLSAKVLQVAAASGWELGER